MAGFNSLVLHGYSFRASWLLYRIFHRPISIFHTVSVVRYRYYASGGNVGTPRYSHPGSRLLRLVTPEPGAIWQYGGRNSWLFLLNPVLFGEHLCQGMGWHVKPKAVDSLAYNVFA